MTSPSRPRRTRAAAPARSTTLRLAAGTIAALGVTLFSAPQASAVNYVQSANGATWGIHDAAAPALDTGSIRDITGNAFYGFGGLRMTVPGIADDDPTKPFNGELMRGFGLKFDGIDSFTTTDAVMLGAISVTRELKVDKAGNYARFYDTFTNTGQTPITITVAFGGSAGVNTGNQAGTTSNQSKVAATSDGDQAIEPADSWVAISNPPPGGNPVTAASSRGPSAVVLGSPAPFAGAITGVGNFQRGVFTNDLAAGGLEANFYGYRTQVTIFPQQTKALLRYVVAGRAETGGIAPGTQTAAVTTKAGDLTATPDLTGLSVGQICAIANFELTTLPGVDPAACAAATYPSAGPAAKPTLATTTSPYDVVGKSIAELAADMEAGKTTSQEIVRAYLDRIAAYDVGQYGFHSFISVADDAMAQARAADEARAKGDTRELLGVPIAVKDLYDTKDLPTTDGTLALDGWQPKRDATQVAGLREAGAIVIGKTNLSEFANSGSYSESGYGMVWNAHKPSKTSLGSSGGSAVATALSLAAGSMGSQTGVSLFAPATGAGLVTMRGTDGMSSGAGVMPLTWLQDYEGPIARSTTDVAMILNATTGTDPDDPSTVFADADNKRPEDWKAALSKDALKGKKIGYVEAAFTGGYTYGQSDGTGEAAKAKLAELEAAGATLVEMSGAQPSTVPTGSLSGSRTEEGWQRYWDRHPEGPFKTAAEILSSPKNLPYNRRTLAPSARLNEADVQQILTTRAQSKQRYKEWMEANGVDAVVYPGFRSDVYDNDGAQTLSSDRSSGYPTSSFGLPTLVLPVGANPHGDPITLQIVGAAYDDAKVLGFGYALEQRLAGTGQFLPAAAPPLAYDATATPQPIEIPKPQVPVTQPPAPDKPAEGAPQQPLLAVTFPSAGKLRGTKVRVTVVNSGTVQAVGRVLVKGTVKRKGKTRSVTYGSTTISIPVGQTRTISIQLNASGKARIKGKKKVKLGLDYRLQSAPALTQNTSKPVSLTR